MRRSAWPSGAKFPSPGRRSASAVKTLPGCMRCEPGCSGAGEPAPVGTNLQSWLSATDRPDGCNGASQSPQHGHAMLSPLCTRGAVVREHPLTAQALGRCRARQQNEGWLCPPRQKALLCKGVFQGHLAPAGAPPGARKRSGKNLVFPRGPAAALASGMIVISALRRNNTPRVAQEGPSVTLGRNLGQHPPQRVFWPL